VQADPDASLVEDDLRRDVEGWLDQLDADQIFRDRGEPEHTWEADGLVIRMTAIPRSLRRDESTFRSSGTRCPVLPTGPGSCRLKPASPLRAGHRDPAGIGVASRPREGIPASNGHSRTLGRTSGLSPLGPACAAESPRSSRSRSSSPSDTMHLTAYLGFPDGSRSTRTVTGSVPMARTTAEFNRFDIRR
jgi:hypothetical protein